MTVTVENIIPAKVAEAVQTAQYTSTNAKTIIDKFTVTNTTAGALTISVNLIPTAGSASAGNLIVDNQSISANSTYAFPELVGHTLRSGDFISTIASAAAGMTMRASGRIIT